MAPGAISITDLTCISKSKNALYKPFPEWLKPESGDILLDRLCARFELKSLNAIMGPSGAGKSMFFNCILQKANQSVKGKINVQSDRTRVSFISSNVEDHLLLKLNVIDTLKYSMRIKNVNSCSKSNTKRRGN